MLERLLQLCQEMRLVMISPSQSGILMNEARQESLFQKIIARIEQYMNSRKLVEKVSLLYLVTSNSIMLCYCVWLSCFYNVPYPLVNSILFSKVIIWNFLTSIGVMVIFGFISYASWKWGLIFFNVIFLLLFSFLSLLFNNGS